MTHEVTEGHFPETEIETLASASPPPPPPQRPETTSKSISRTKYVLLLSYASAVTIALVVVLILLVVRREHALESLPDLKPKIRDKEVALELVPEGAEMAYGHTLRLGESRRFGSVSVTPLRVTRGSLSFVHFSGDASNRRPATGPVLQLWLRIENVSSDQAFPPLDRKLILTRVAGDENLCHWRANNFVYVAAEKSENVGRHVLVYDLPEESSWEWSGEASDHVLKPGETLEACIPSAEEGIDDLQGDLLWRVHFRKGYHPESLRGVTTLIEVAFNSSEIVNEDEVL